MKTQYKVVIKYVGMTKAYQNRFNTYFDALKFVHAREDLPAFLSYEIKSVRAN